MQGLQKRVWHKPGKGRWWQDTQNNLGRMLPDSLLVIPKCLHCAQSILPPLQSWASKVTFKGVWSLFLTLLCQTILAEVSPFQMHFHSVVTLLTPFPHWKHFMLIRRSKPLLIHHTEVHKPHLRICLSTPSRQTLGWDVQPCPQDGLQGQAVPSLWHSPVLDSEDQLVEPVHVLEAGLVCHWVDDQETISSPHVLLPHCTELLLACSIQN